MNTLARFNEGLLPDADGSKAAAAEHLSATTGTFSLRRALYLNKTGQPPKSLSTDSGVVLPFENTNRSGSNPALTPVSPATKRHC